MHLTNVGFKYDLSGEIYKVATLGIVVMLSIRGREVRGSNPTNPPPWHFVELTFEYVHAVC